MNCENCYNYYFYTLIQQRLKSQPAAINVKSGLVPAHTGLRGLLALYIMIFHSILFSVGWNLHGVTIIPFFFLLSGYSLAISYGKNQYSSQVADNGEEKATQNFKFNFKHFYQNRFARIIPIYYLAIFFGVVLAIFDRSWIASNNIGLTIFTNLFAVQTWLGLPPKSFIASSWTISTLIFFYLVFPWLLKKYQNQTSHSLNRTIAILAVVQAIVFLILYFGISFLFGDREWAAWGAYSWPISRIFVFEMGLIAGLLVVRQEYHHLDAPITIMGISNGRENSWGRKLDWYAGILIVLILVSWVIDETMGINYCHGALLMLIFPYLMLQLIVGLSIVEPGENFLLLRLLSSKPLLFLGNISLTLYLIHEPIIQYVAWLTRPYLRWENTFIIPAMSPWGIPVVILVSIAVSVLLERYVETPIRDLFKSKSL